MKLYKMDVVTRGNDRIETPVAMQPGERSMRFSRRIHSYRSRFRHEGNSSRNTGEGDRFDRDRERGRERERERREEKKIVT